MQASSHADKQTSGQKEEKRKKTALPVSICHLKTFLLSSVSSHLSMVAIALACASACSFLCDPCVIAGKVKESIRRRRRKGGRGGQKTGSAVAWSHERSTRGRRERGRTFELPLRLHIHASHYSRRLILSSSSNSLSSRFHAPMSPSLFHPAFPREGL